MHRIHFLIMVYVLCVFSNFATAYIYGKPCNCTNDIMDCSLRSKSQVHLGEKCPNATKAYFQQNILRDYPEILKFFIEVNMAANLLTTLPDITHLNANVTILVLTANNITNTSKELRQLSSLKILEISNNRLQSLEFLPEPCSLEILSADKNNIASLQGPLRSCTQLHYLSLDANQLQSIPANMFVGMAKLTDLSLNGNPLVTLSNDFLRGLLKLRHLYLVATKLTTIPMRLFSGTPELKKLYLSINGLRDFPSQQISGLAALQELHIWGNSITELPVLRNCCPQLQLVDMDLNGVQAPSEEAVLSFVRGNNSTLLLEMNPLRPRALRWALQPSHGLQPFVGSDSCSCGGLRRRHAPLTILPAVKWCLRVPCGRFSTNANWIAAVNASRELRSGRGPIRPLAFATHEGTGMLRNNDD